MSSRLQFGRRSLPDARPHAAANHRRPAGFPEPDRRPGRHVHLERAAEPERRRLVPLRESHQHMTVDQSR